MELKMWDIGWLPEGWTRGEPLVAYNKNWRAGPTMTFVRDMCGRSLTWRVIESPDEMDIIFSIGFQRPDRRQVERWLLWYFDGEPEAYRIIAQIQ